MTAYKKNRGFINSLLYLYIIVLFYGCAQVVAPSGGPRDTAPPEIVKYIPDSASINFNAKKISIEFNEYIKLNSLNEQLIISPPMEIKPEIIVREKSVIIAFDKNEVLDSNTTYAFRFGNAIQDLNENNPLEDFKYVFSTGSYIDSLTISGNVQSAFNHKTEKGILVMLYRDTDDSVIYKEKPNYFSKTKEDGSFTITNIKEGNYRLYALKDENANYLYDESESIAFHDTIIDASVNKETLLELFEEPVKKCYLKKYVYNSYGKILFVFNKASDSINIKTINHSFDKDDTIIQHSTNNDSITYWFRNITKDSLSFEVSNGVSILDTIAISLSSKEEAINHKKNPLKLKLLTSLNGKQTVDLDAEIALMFNHPIDQLTSKNKIELTEDSIPFKSDDVIKLYQISQAFNTLTVGTVKTESASEWPTDSSLTTTVQLVPALSTNTSYDLFIPPNSFTDFFGFENDSINISFKTEKAEHYGTLQLNLELVTDSLMKATAETKNYIIQLLNKDEKVIRENHIRQSETINYNNLHPNIYKLKVIYDSNTNKKWDTGNLLKKQQAETIIYNAEEIKIRSNWDLEIDWKVTK